MIDGPAGKTGIKIKFSAGPKPAKGLWQALEDLEIKRAFVVAPVARRYPRANGVEVVPVWDVRGLLTTAGGGH